MSVALKTAPGQRLRADAAAAFDAANSARRWVLTDSERPLATQIQIFLERYLPARTGGGYYGDVRWWKGVRYVRKKGTAAAAVPGTSNHGTGTAIDVSGLGPVGSAAWEAFRRDVEPHGWRHPAWAKTTNFYEPWHWEYSPALDTRPVSNPGPSTGGAITTPTIPGRPAPINPQEWDDMATKQEVTDAVVDALNGWRAGVGGRNIFDLGNQTLAQLGGLATDLDEILAAIKEVPGSTVLGVRVEGRNIVDWLKQLRAEQAAHAAAYQAAIRAVATGTTDTAAIQAAAEAGAKTALNQLADRLKES